ncbi:Uncharacterized oxidoreductase SAV2478 [Acholeplasma oculi]|uniref:Short-chain dehydrogenase/reductase family protein n=1 Tax=Acholeplasma oculi TaxID=35623 RepID=A0A061AAD9_9MOLU|nr:oxidoreductase [Acholeplasma oculi]CDR30798.1 Short-chain dehydrogenase/reductase family protein [Acholeplasma oculi]SKC35012.1 Short-chain dehydrogenase [Acholeplasma oculi]SUT89768.1 Uncharacterized oxidoreductase SAV2478 [Acholeplasma oculi]
MKDKKVVIITGASSGIGKSTALYLNEKGYTVYALARRKEKLEELLPFGIKIIPCDVTKLESSKQAIDEIYHKEGRIDVLFNNAGFGLYGPIELVKLSDARYQFEVNLFGLVQMTNLVVPIMRNQGHGRIINTSSIGGKVASLLGGWYHASKFALEGLSDSLRIELKQFGIKVILIEPGLIQTEFMGVTFDLAQQLETDSPYQSLFEKVKRDAKRDYFDKKVGSDPIVVAKKVYKAIQSKHPKTRYSMGRLSKIALISKKILPDKVMDYILLKR